MKIFLTGLSQRFDPLLDKCPCTGRRASNRSRCNWCQYTLYQTSEAANFSRIRGVGIKFSNHFLCGLFEFLAVFIRQFQIAEFAEDFLHDHSQVAKTVWLTNDCLRLLYVLTIYSYLRIV